jgi:RNA polymerase sigma factor (sigma-70 family)
MAYKRWTNDDPVRDEALLAQWSRFVQHVAYRVRRSYSMQDADVEDIVSDINLRLLSIPVDTRPYEGYCKTVITNAARDSIRDRMRHGAGPNSQWRDYTTMDYKTAAPRRRDKSDEEDDVSAIDHLVSVPSPESELVNALSLDNVIAGLPVEQQEVIRLYYGESLTYREIAERMGYSQQGVRRLVLLACSSLRSKFSK